jgi:hypothetical protein
MTAALAFRTVPAAAIIVDAARCWRVARDAGGAVQVALYARLAPLGLGILAPVFDSLLRLFEHSARRAFRPGEAGAQALSGDEQHLLRLLAKDDVERAPLLRIAIQSTRIMLRLVDGDIVPASDQPIFFAAPLASNTAAHPSETAVKAL